MFDSLFNYLTTNKDGLEIMIKIGTFVVSLFTLTWAIITGIKSIKNIALNRKNKQLADFIALFSDKNEIKRLSGINGLSLYSRTLFKELFFICSIEKDAIIKELIYNSLKKESPHMLKACIHINSFLVDFFLYYDYQSKAFIHLMADKAIVDTLKFARTERRIQLELNKRNSNSVFERDYAIDNHLILSSKLLALAVSKSLYIHLNGILIVQSDMYTSKWICNYIENCVFTNNVARHTFLLLTKCHYCYIGDNDYFESRLIKSSFIKCNMRNSSFRNSNFIQTTFQEGEIHNTVFNKSTLTKCTYTQVKEIDTCFWNACMIKRARFDEIKIVSNELYDVRIVATSFRNIKFWRNKLIGDFKSCQFNTVVWGGSELKNVKFTNCVFDNVNFAGAILKHCQFINCKFTNTDFAKMRSDDTVFNSCITSTKKARKYEEDVVK